MSKIDYQVLREKAGFTKERIIEELKASTQNASGMFEISEDTICALMSILAAQPQLPQPSVPDEMPAHIGPREFGRPQAYIDGWNACRAAMLHGSEPETDNTNQQFESLSRGDK